MMNKRNFAELVGRIIENSSDSEQLSLFDDGLNRLLSEGYEFDRHEDKIVSSYLLNNTEEFWQELTKYSYNKISINNLECFMIFLAKRFLQDKISLIMIIKYFNSLYDKFISEVHMIDSISEDILMEASSLMHDYEDNLFESLNENEFISKIIFYVKRKSINI